MREIKFRGKHRTQGYWVFGGIKANTYSAYIVGEDFEKYDVDPDTVGQYTGLKDKNGAEIYEGDILTMDSWNPNIVEVCFDDGAFCLKQENIPYMSDIHYVHHAGQPQASIVCNIHDNPELLKGGER